MQKRPVLVADKRKITGKKVKSLRREGLLPANVYGKNQDSVSIQVNAKEFETVYDKAGETGLIDLTIGNDTKPVLVKNLQLKYPLRTPLHVDFYQVNLKEKVKSMIPVEIIGEAKAVTENLGTLLTPLNEIEVEALPADLPEKIEVDVSKLEEVDAQIIVSGINIPTGVTVLTEPDQIVVKIAELTKEEPVEAPVAEEGTEGEEPAEGEEKTEGKSESDDKKPENTEVKTEDAK